MKRVIGAGFAALVLAGCAPSSPTANTTPSHSATPPIRATGLVTQMPAKCCLSGVMPVAITAIQRLTGDPYVSQGPPASGAWSCPAQACAWGGTEQDGQDAATVSFSINGVNDGGYGCVLYLAKLPTRGWQYVESSCGQNILTPRLNVVPTAWVSTGCAHERQEPSLSGQITGCVTSGSTLLWINDGPVYADSHLWWHNDNGWIAQDFLLPPDQGAAHSVADDTFPRSATYSYYTVCGVTGDTSSCPYTGRLKLRLAAARVTLCRCQNPFTVRLLGADPVGTGGTSEVAHVLGNESFDLVLVNVNGRLLVDDERCLGGPASTSIYVSIAPCA